VKDWPNGRIRISWPISTFWARAISLERTKLDISNLVCRLNAKSTAITHIKVLQFGGVFWVTRPFWEISASISETVPDSDAVTMED